MTVLAHTLFALLMATPVVPPSPGFSETGEEREARLESIAVDAADAAEENPTKALLILSTSQHESGFELSVDKGPCYRGKDGKGPQCDHGQAACMMQIHGTDAERASFFADRKLCFRRGLTALLNSKAMCIQYGEEYQFGAYAAGNCKGGLEGSKQLTEYWKKWIDRYQVERAKERETEKKLESEGKDKAKNGPKQADDNRKTSTAFLRPEDLWTGPDYFFPLPSLMLEAA